MKLDPNTWLFKAAMAAVAAILPLIAWLFGWVDRIFELPK